MPGCRVPGRWKEIVRLRFEGPSFEGHAIVVPALAELLRYQELLKETAKAVYRRANPAAGRLPDGFDEMLTLRMSAIEGDSVVIPLEAREPNGQMVLESARGAHLRRLRPS
jgi:hypothetical protein